MSSAPKFYLLHIDGISSDPVKLWSIGEVAPYIARHAEQALSSGRLELMSDIGERILDKNYLRRSAYYAKFGKWQLLSFVIFSLVLLSATSNPWLRSLGGAGLLVSFIFQMAPSWPSFVMKLCRDTQRSKKQ